MKFLSGLKNHCLAWSVGLLLATAALPSVGQAFDTSTLTDRQAQSVVRALYRDYMNRTVPVSAGEANAWVNHLRVYGAKGVAQQLLISEEKRQNLITIAYLRYLDRAPEAAALAQYMQNLRTGTPMVDIWVVLTASPEYAARCGSNNRGFLVCLYQDILGASPSQDEIESWLPILRNSGKAEVIHRFFNSLEYREKMVVSFYSKYLRRFPSTAEVADWTELLALGQTMDDVETSIVGSDEYVARNVR